MPKFKTKGGKPFEWEKEKKAKPVPLTMRQLESLQSELAKKSPEKEPQPMKQKR